MTIVADAPAPAAPRAGAVWWSPIYMRNVDLILGDPATGTNFKCQLRSVTLSPDVNITRIKTLCPTGQFANVDDPEWTLDLTYLYGVTDDATGSPSLSDYLLANFGKEVEFTFRPVSGGVGYHGTVTVIPGPIGGDQGSFSEQSVSLPVEGQPTTVAAPTQPAPEALNDATYPEDATDDDDADRGEMP